jgi:hypothetical protein
MLKEAESTKWKAESLSKAQMADNGLLALCFGKGSFRD